MEGVLCGREQLEDAHLRGETLASLVWLWGWELGEIPGRRPPWGGTDPLGAMQPLCDHAAPCSLWLVP